MRAFPSAPESEKATLAALALDPTAVRAICALEGVDKDWFHLPAYAAIWEAASAILDSGRALDFQTLGRRLEDTAMLEKVGGGAFLNELWSFLPSAANVRDYLAILRDKWTRRRIIAECHAATEAAHHHEDASEVAGELHCQIGALLQTRSKRPSHREVLQSIVDEVREGRDDSGLVTVPLQGIHGRLRLYRGDLLMITAPTSCGKTALATQMALAVAKTHRIALYPLEMAQRQVMKRAIAQNGGHNPDFVRKLVKDTGDKPSAYTMAVVKEFMEVARALANLDIHMRDDLTRWDQIRADIRMEHGRRPFTFVLIDYLQLVQLSGRHERRQLAIAEITQGAKLLAGELECVVCMPSQVNKEGGTREGQDAENDASALIKIHPKEGAEEPEPGRVTIWKQREGQRHLELPISFNPELTRFDPLP